MHFGLYTGASAALATGAVIRACLERPNFYSSSVYIAQSNACLFILVNLALLSTYSVLLGLQKAFYGPLRPVEVEQLWEKAWFAYDVHPYPSETAQFALAASFVFLAVARITDF
ncbi:MAG: hypothetical protein Q9212_001769 [Teloschistes hypoglaucus]